MAQENDEGSRISKGVAAAAHFIGRDADRAAVEASPAEPARTLPAGGFGTNEHYLGAEKRRSTRYKCEGSAEIQEDGREVRTWATFSDISLDGCYVEAQATYPVGQLCI